MLFLILTVALVRLKSDVYCNYSVYLALPVYGVLMVISCRKAAHQSVLGLSVVGQGVLYKCCYIGVLELVFTVSQSVHQSFI